jgi:hypothetical protein
MKGKLAFHFVHCGARSNKGFYLVSCISIRIMLHEYGGQYVQHHRDFMHKITKRLNLKLRLQTGTLVSSYMRLDIQHILRTESLPALFNEVWRVLVLI